MHPRADSTAGAQLLVLLGLTGFAISQPLLGVLGTEPTWFTFRGADRSHIILFALVVAVAPPLALWAAGLAVRAASARWAWWTHLLAVTALAGLAIEQVARTSDVPTLPLLVVSGVGAAGFGVAYAAQPGVRLWSRYTAVLPVLAVGAFVLASPTGDLVTARASGPADAVASDAPSVLFLLLDELPTQSLLGADGQIDSVRFPNLAALADDGTWYPSYSTSASFTRMAVPSILASTAPQSDQPTFTNHPDTLFTLLAPTHEMRVSETVTQLCDPATCPASEGAGGALSIVADLVADGAGVLRDRISLHDEEPRLDDFAPDLQANEASSPGAVADPDWVGQVPTVHAEFLRTIEPVDRPTLWFLHLLLPHQPWHLYPDGREYEAPASFDELVTDGQPRPWIDALTEQQHLLQLQYTDALVGQALDALRDAGEYDDTIVVVTADHGVSFRTGSPRRAATEDNVTDLAYAPLIIKAPGGEPTSAGNVVSDDLLPTIAELLDLSVPWEVRGHPIGSAAQLDRGPTKEFYDFGLDFVRPPLEGIITFYTRDGSPSIEDRWVGPIDARDGPLAGLLDIVEAGPWLGRTIDEVARGSVDADAEVQSPDALRDPSSVPPGFVIVRMEGDLDVDDVVLLELNGTIVTAAPYTTVNDGRARVHLMLPPGALAPAGNEWRLAVVRGGSVLELQGG